MTFHPARIATFAAAHPAEQLAERLAVPADPALDTERERVAVLARDAARDTARGFKRFAGKALACISEANAVDVEVEQVNERLAAAGRDDLVQSAASQTTLVLDPWLIDALFVIVVHRGARG